MNKVPMKEKKSTSAYDMRELARELGLCERSLREALRRGEVPHIRVGRSLHFASRSNRRMAEECGNSRVESSDRPVAYSPLGKTTLPIDLI